MPNTTPARLLEEIVLHGPDHRAALARTLRVSRTAISNAVQSLDAAGIVEVPARSTTSPTLKDAVRMTSHAGLAGSIVMTSGAVSVGLGTFDGALAAQSTTEVPAGTDGRERLELALTMLAEAQGSLPSPGPLRAVHLAVNTQSDRTTGEVLGGQASRQWARTNPKLQAEDALGVPVMIENTARLLALAEQRGRADPASQDLVYVHLSHGITAGHVVGGTIMAGARGGAGELGHLSIDQNGRRCECGSRGCLMQYAGRRALDDRAAELLGRDAGARRLLEAAAQEPGAARDLVLEVAGMIGGALAGVCNLLGPSMVVLGGDIAPAESLMLEGVASELRSRALPMAADGLTIQQATISRNEGAVLTAGLGCLRSAPDVRSLVITAGLAALTRP